MILDGSKCREINEALVDLGFFKKMVKEKFTKKVTFK